MSSPPPPDRAARGQARLAARARRIAQLRRRVTAATLATFALAWGVIAWHGAMGEQTTTPTVQVARVTATATATPAVTATATDTAAATSSSDLTTSQS
jgi:hypothetical protein